MVQKGNNSLLLSRSRSRWCGWCLSSPWWRDRMERRSPLRPHQMMLSLFHSWIISLKNGKLSSCQVIKIHVCSYRLSVNECDVHRLKNELQSNIENLIKCITSVTCFDIFVIKSSKSFIYTQSRWSFTFNYFCLLEFVPCAHLPIHLIPKTLKFWIPYVDSEEMDLDLEQESVVLEPVWLTVKDLAPTPLSFLPPKGPEFVLKSFLFWTKMIKEPK